VQPFGRHDMGLDPPEHRSSAAQPDPTASAIVDRLIGTPSRA